MENIANELFSPYEHVESRWCLDVAVMNVVTLCQTQSKWLHKSSLPPPHILMPTYSTSTQHIVSNINIITHSIYHQETFLNIYPRNFIWFCVSLLHFSSMPVRLFVGWCGSDEKPLTYKVVKSGSK